MPEITPSHDTGVDHWEKELGKVNSELKKETAAADWADDWLGSSSIWDWSKLRTNFQAYYENKQRLKRMELSEEKQRVERVLREMKETVKDIEARKKYREELSSWYSVGGSVPDELEPLFGKGKTVGV